MIANSVVANDSVMFECLYRKWWHRERGRQAGRKGGRGEKERVGKRERKSSLIANFGLLCLPVFSFN